jgi:hypothetical protein
MRKTLGALGATVAGIAMTFTTVPAVAAEAGTIFVPDDFSTSETRSTGHLDVVGTGLRIWTDGATSTDKVAEYVATDTALAEVGEATLEFTNTSGGGAPGYQLRVDLDNDGTSDGILVGEPAYYGDRWWANNQLTAFVAANPGAVSVVEGSEYPYSTSLATWSEAYPEARVDEFGFSLGSGVKGDGIIDAINFAGTRYTFAEHVTLTSKEECKNGGWATSTKPVYENQGDCVSDFASTK